LLEKDLKDFNYEKLQTATMVAGATETVINDKIAKLGLPSSMKVRKNKLQDSIVLSSIWKDKM